MIEFNNKRIVDQAEFSFNQILFTSASPCMMRNIPIYTTYKLKLNQNHFILNFTIFMRNKL